MQRDARHARRRDGVLDVRRRDELGRGLLAAAVDVGDDRGRVAGDDRVRGDVLRHDRARARRPRGGRSSTPATHGHVRAERGEAVHGRPPPVAVEHRARPDAHAVLERHRRRARPRARRPCTRADRDARPDARVGEDAAAVAERLGLALRARIDEGAQGARYHRTPPGGLHDRPAHPSDERDRPGRDARRGREGRPVRGRRRRRHRRRRHVRRVALRARRAGGRLLRRPGRPRAGADRDRRGLGDPQPLRDLRGRDGRASASSAATT